METLRNLNKLWRSSALLPPTTTTTTYLDAQQRFFFNKTDLGGEYYEEDAEEQEEEEESFFELELGMLNNPTTAINSTKENEGMRLNSKEGNNTTVNGGRRVVPVEPHLKSHPHSPISILKSSRKFKVSLFRKHKDDHHTTSELKPKPRLEDEEEESSCKATISTLIRENSNPVSGPQKHSICNADDSDSLPMDSSSMRFPKDVMQKYLKLKLIKPLHLKVARRCGNVVTNNSNKSRLFELRNDCTASPASSASALKSRSSSGGLRVVCKQLGKSRSASSSVISSRRDESLVMVEHDDGGIQSAILHCKRSFNSSGDSSVHSRSSSDSREQEATIII